MNKAIPTITVGELISRGEADVQTGPFGTQLKASEYVDFGIPVINVRNVGFGDIRDAELEFITDAKAEKLKAHQLRKGDIVFGRKGAVERHALIDEEQSGWVQGSDCLRLRLKSSSVCERYASYYLRTRAHQDWMQALCSFGATMASLNQDIVKRITIPLPPLTTQRKIAAILTAYDDLIEINRRRIALLEKMAEELYREWFVRMRFPGHQDTRFVKGVPEGWEVKRLGELLELAYGKALKEADREPGEFPVYGSGGVIGCHSKPIVRDKGIIVGRKGNVGAVFFSDKGFFPIDTVFYVVSDLSLSYLFFLLRSMNFINNDAAVPGLNRNQAYSNQLLFPGKKLIEQFAEIADSIFNLIKELQASIANLTKTRDLLLPRLISGKLSVEDLDIQFPPSMCEEAA